MNDTAHNHPSQKLLTDYGHGKLDPDASHLIEEHLAECNQCGETLLNLQDDTFINLVRRSDAVEVPTDTRQEAGNANEYGKTVTEATGGDAPAAPESEFDLPAALADHPRYRIVELLGRGGMGDVYRAQHIVMDRPVALKVINREFVQNLQAVERFRREVHAAARLSHPNIVTAHDAEQAGDLHYLVMEFVDGTDLSQLVEERGALPVQEACDYVRQAALGLQHAHEQGMVHRDIKPHNLMVAEDGTVRILDFGLAGFAAESALMEAEAAADGKSDTMPLHLTRMGSVMGTPDYIAPEQAQDAHSADIRADIYSLGCTLYFLLAGGPPHKADSVVEKLQAHAKEEPPAIESVRVDIPDDLAEVIQRMMAKDPAERLQTPQEVADALAPFVDEHRTSDPGSSAVAASSRVLGHRRGWWFIAVLAAVLVGLMGIIYVATDTGTLVIESVDDNVEIMIGRPVSDTDEGLEVKIVDRVTGSEVVRLPSGHYRVLLGQGEDLNVNVDVKSLRLSREQFTLSRGGKVIVRVKKKPPRDAGEPQTVEEPDQITRVRTFNVNTSHVNGMVYSRDGSRLYVAGRDPVVRVFDVDSGDLVDTLIDQKNGIGSIAISPDGRYLATGDYEGGILIWETEQGALVGELSGHTKQIPSLAFSPDGKRLLSGSFDRTVRLWDIEDLNNPRELHQTNFTGFSGQVAFSADGRLALHGDEEGIVVWETDTGQVVRRLSGNGGSRANITISPDGKSVLSAYQNLVLMWNLESGKDVRSFAAHTARVTHVAFTSDGRFVVSGGDDKTLRLWNASTGDELKRVERNEQFSSVLCVAPSGRYVSSAIGYFETTDRNSDCTVHLWQLPELDSPTETAEPAIQTVVQPETRQALKDLVAAARQASTAEEWDKVLKQHAPLLEMSNEAPEGDLKKLGEEAIAKLREGGRKFIELLAGLPDDVHENLLKTGYLKWKFTELDEPRQTAMRVALTTFFSATDKMGFPAGLKDQVPKMLASGDVGFAVIDTSKGQGVVWYFLIPDAPIPIMFPLFGTPPDGGKSFMSRSVYQQIGDLENKPYSDLLLLLKETDLRRLQGVWKFVRGEANGRPSTPRTLEIAANVWLLKDPNTGRTIQRMTFEIDPTRNPKQITVTSADFPQPLNGIYKIDGDELHITSAGSPGGERPTEFDQGGPGKFFIVMRREPPPELERMLMEKALKQLQERHDASKEIAYAVWELDGKAVLRFANWLLVFEGIDAAPGVSGLGVFRDPDKRYDDSKREGGGVTFGTNESPLKLEIDERIIDGIGHVTVNDFRFQMEGKAEKLIFENETYKATGDVLTIVVRASGATAEESRLKK